MGPVQHPGHANESEYHVAPERTDLLLEEEPERSKAHIGKPEAAQKEPWARLFSLETELGRYRPSNGQEEAETTTTIMHQADYSAEGSQDTERKLAAMQKPPEKIRGERNLLENEYRKLGATTDRYRSERDVARAENRQLKKQDPEYTVLHEKYCRLFRDVEELLAHAGVQSLGDLEQMWDEKKLLAEKTEEAEAMLKKLQAEVLSSVDRFNPGLDEQIQNEFKG